MNNGTHANGSGAHGTGAPGNGAHGANGNGFGPSELGGSPLGLPRALAGTPEMARVQRTLGEPEEKRRFSPSDYLRLLWKGKWIIAACIAVAGMLTAYYTYSLPFIYEASLDIAVNEGEEQPVFGQPVWYRNRDRALKNELQFMTSRPVYASTARALVQQRFLDTIKGSELADSVIPMLYVAERRLAPKLHGASPADREERLVDFLAGVIEQTIAISPSKDADVIRVSVKSGDPVEAAVVTNTYAETYAVYSRLGNQAKVEGLEKFLGNRLDTTRLLLSGTEIELRDFMAGNNIVGEKINGAELLASEQSMKEALTQVGIEITGVQRRLAERRSQLASIEPSFATDIAKALPEVISHLTARLAKEEAGLMRLLSENPKAGSEVWKNGVIAAKKKAVADLKKELEDKVQQHKISPLGSLPGAGDLASNGPTGPLTALRGEIFEDEIALNTLRARQSAIQSAMGDIRGEMSTIPDKSMELDRLTRTKSSLEEIYKELEDSYIKKIIDKQSIMSNVRVISPAAADTNPISPNRRANMVLGIIVGLGLGVGIVLLIAYADTTIHSPDELTEKGFTVLAAIPAIEGFMSKSGRQPVSAAGTSALSPHLIAFSDPDSPITESYRSLRTAIQFASIVEPIRMLLVTSSVPQEGKSTTSANLGIVMANSGMRTLLIDCDLRRPIAHANFGMTKEPGLVNALVGETPIEQSIRPSGIPNLDILPSGSIPPNPSELLGSKRMSDMLATLREMYDLVLIDSPPVGIVTDGVILSTKVDATIAVVRAHKTRMEFLDRTNEDVSRVGTPLLGVVLNEFDASQSYGSSYKYYRYYKYYGYYGSKDGAGSRKGRRAKAAKQTASVTN